MVASSSFLCFDLSYYLEHCGMLTLPFSFLMQVQPFCSSKKMLAVSLISSFVLLLFVFASLRNKPREYIDITFHFLSPHFTELYSMKILYYL
jgi:hypothetical protein